MPLNDRQTDIMARLQSGENLEVEQLSSAFGVATQTVRKDINQLCELGLARRIHGGVAPSVTTRNTPFGMRSHASQGVKQHLARQVWDLVADDSTIMVGNGTTVTEAARVLVRKTGLHVLTNNLSVTSVFCENSDIRVRVCEGELRHEEQDLVGHKTIEFFNRYRADVGLCSASGLDPVDGVLEFDTDEAGVSEAIWKNARLRVLITDSSKWARRATVKAQALKNIDVFITDGFPDGQLRELVRESVGTLIETKVHQPS